MTRSNSPSRSDMPVCILVAVSKNNCIGKDGELPWKLPEDMKRFKELTMGKIVVMGRKTWESLPEKFRPLPGRKNVVVTRQTDYMVPPGVEVFSSLQDALAARQGDETFVIGGAQIYAQALPLTDRLYVTHVDETVQGDAFFPQIDATVWTKVAEEPHPGYSFTVYERTLPMKGLFIVIDGTDGSGKTVQANRLIERLRQSGRQAELLDFPRYGKPSAYFVEKYLHGDYGTAEQVSARQASLFFALDRFDASFTIREKLEQGVILVSNRYVSANKGHHMGKVKDPDEQIKFLDWLNDLEYGILGIPKPDLTLLLHVTAEIGFELARARDSGTGKKDILQSNLEHLQNAERAYLRLPEIDTVENWQIVECVENGKLSTIETIHEKLWNVVSKMI